LCEELRRCRGEKIEDKNIEIRDRNVEYNRCTEYLKKARENGEKVSEG